MAKMVYVVIDELVNMNEVAAVFDDKNKLIKYLINLVRDEYGVIEWYCEEYEININDYDDIKDADKVVEYLTDKLNKDIHFLDEFYVNIVTYWLNEEEP